MQKKLKKLFTLNAKEVVHPAKEPEKVVHPKCKRT